MFHELSSGLAPILLVVSAVSVRICKKDGEQIMPLRVPRIIDRDNDD